MNSALDHFAEDNAVLDELVFLPPKEDPIRRIRATSSMFRKPFIEVEMASGETFQRHFAREHFADDWARAAIVLETLTDIELVSELRLPPVAEAEALRRRALAVREECLAEAERMYDRGLYLQYLLEFGPNCKDLDQATRERIARARAEVAARD